MDYVIFLILSNIAYTKFSEGPFWKSYFRIEAATHGICCAHLQQELVYADEQMMASQINSLLESASDFSTAASHWSSNSSLMYTPIRFPVLLSIFLLSGVQTPT